MFPNRSRLRSFSAFYKRTIKKRNSVFQSNTELNFYFCYFTFRTECQYFTNFRRFSTISARKFRILSISVVFWKIQKFWFPFSVKKFRFRFPCFRFRFLVMAVKGTLERKFAYLPKEKSLNSTPGTLRAGIHGNCLQTTRFCHHFTFFCQIQSLKTQQLKTLLQMLVQNKNVIRK